MKTALIFPGQGSQYIGMGKDFYEAFEIVRETFVKLDQISGREISNLIFSGNSDALSETENSQPAIMATSVAILNALISKNILQFNSFQAVAGHSLGEYSALVANGSITFEESVHLLKIRSKAMQESMPLGSGGMIALIGCDHEIISEVLEKASDHGKIYISNDNALGQVVLSGEMNSIDYILSNKKNLKIRKAIKLSVSAPFHCELMGHASNILSSEVKKVKFKNFNVPLYSNVTSAVCNHDEISDLLVKQVLCKVRWRETVENMISDGFTKFIEIGPGNVLTNLIKRISNHVESYSISKVEDLKKIG